MKPDSDAIKQYLLDFLAKCEFSTLFAYDIIDKPDWGEKPVNATFIDGRWKPRIPDGLAIGNREIYAAIGIPELTAETTYEYYCGSGKYNYAINPSRLSILSGPRKAQEQCKILFNMYKTLDLYLGYTFQTKSYEKLLAQCTIKKLLRINKTTINVSKLSDGIIEITCIDFAPLLNTEKDLPVICRYILIKNIQHDFVENVDFGFAAINYGNSWTASYPNTAENNDQDLIILMESGKTREKIHSTPCIGLNGTFSHGFSIDEVDSHDTNTYLTKAKKKSFSKPSSIDSFGLASFNQKILRLEPNAVYFIPLFIITANNPSEAMQISQDLMGWNLTDLLRRTYENATERSNTVYIDTSDAKVNQTIDALQNLLYLHIGYDAIHTGSVYYDPNRAFVRDNYWITRALVKAGNIGINKLNTQFFFDAWQRAGILNSYNIFRKSGSVGTNELRIEIPAYFVLFVEQLWLWTNDDTVLKQYYPMIKDSMDVSQASPNNLFMISGDETWIWPAYVNEMDYYLDSSILMIIAMNFAVKVAKMLGNFEDEQRWNKLANQWRDALNKTLVIKDEKRYANGIDTAGFLDQSLVPTVVSHPILLHKSELFSDFSLQINAPSLIKNALNLIWTTMCQSKIIRSHSKTTSLTGETPGAYLYAVSDFNLSYKHDVFEAVLNFISCTGGVFEIHDIFNPAWGTERRRAWDSAMILEGILQYLFGIIPEERSILFNPSPPINTGYAYISDIPIKKQFFAVRSFNLEDYEQLSEEEISEKQIQPFFHEFGEIDDDFMKSPNIIKEVSVKKNLEDPYTNIIQTNATGKIRYYPENDAVEAGIQDLEEISALIRIVPQNNADTIKVFVDDHTITETFTIIFREILKIDFDFDDLQNTSYLQISNQNRKHIILQIGSDVLEINELEFKKSISVPESADSIVNLEDSDVYLPQKFLTDLDIFLNQNENHCLVLYDNSSKNHMIEIIRQISIGKWEIYPYQEWNPNLNLWEQAPGTNIILITTQPIEIALNTTDLELIDTFKGFQLWAYRDHPSNGFIYIHNSGHVYQDTHPFCEQLGIYLKPTRDKAISMHPYGHYRLSDVIGEPATLPFLLEITATKAINMYIGGILHSGLNYKAIYDPTKNSESFKPIKPYCCFYTIVQYTDFAIAAGGIATGQNCLRIIGEADADEPITITYKLNLEQTYHAIHLAGTQRERILDTITLEKQSNGQKIFTILLHPGTSMHPIQKAPPSETNKRGFAFTFGRYPRIKHNLGKN